MVNEMSQEDGLRRIRELADIVKNGDATEATLSEITHVARAMGLVEPLKADRE